MFADQIRKLLMERPFTPFTVHLSEGESFRVHHPDYAFLSPLGERFEVYGEDGRLAGWLQVSHIRKITDEQQAGTSSVEAGERR